MLFLAHFLVPAEAGAQLRPLEPLQWRAFLQQEPVRAQIGVGVHQDMRAAVAGTVGDLLELGNIMATVRTGRVVIEAGGTLQRRFKDERVYAPPLAGTRESNGETRVDAGDYRISTAIRLTRMTSPVLGVLRFGTRLPTTNNRVGLDRDATDFFATVGAAYHGRRLLLAGEAGLGIFGTRVPTFEQSDELVLIGGAEYELGALQALLWYTAHNDELKDRTIRGNEHQREVRIGVRYGRKYWIEGYYVAGQTLWNPKPGVLVNVGGRF